MTIQKTSTLLLVDDNPDNLSLLQQVLSQYLPDCEVHTARNAHECLTAAATIELDGALINYQMSDMAGIEICRRLKSNPDLAQVPVILLTDNSSSSKIKEEGLEVGVDDFIARPIDSVELVARIKTILRMKKAEDQLRTIDKGSGERWKFAVEGSASGVWDWDVQTNETYFSELWKNILGYEGNEIGTSGEEWVKRVHPDDMEVANKEIQKHFQGEIPFYSFEHRMMCKDGTYKWFQGRGKVISRTADGQPSRMVGTNTDITDRKQNEEKRRELESQLQQAHKMEAIGTLAGGIAHDFNNQLSGILGYSTLLEKILTEENQQKYLQRIKQATQRAANLTQQLLAFSRRGKHLATPTDMNIIIHDVASILEHSIDKKIQIHSRLNPTETIVVGDPSQLQNAILNIALNARDAITAAGNIEFSNEVVTLDQSYCDNAPYDLSPGQFLKLGVIDNGSGMDEETQSRIFEPFFTTKEVGKGTGMGLASVYGTITEHKGMIHVSSKVGKGTTFCIYLPLAKDSHAEEIKTGNDAPICGQARVLIVDDEEDVRMVAAEMLEELGYKTTLCVSGQDAIEYYRKSWMQTDLVILDMMMPGLSGKETFLALHKINPQVRTVLLSGYSLNEQVQEILDAGVQDFLGKPFEEVELSKVVANALRQEQLSPS